MGVIVSTTDSIRASNIGVRESDSNVPVDERPRWSDVIPLPRHPAPPRQRDLRSMLGRARAWMLVVPVDAAMLLTPLIWAPEQWKAHVAMTVLTIAMLTGGGRYRARLHLSVLDDLPTLSGKVLMAAGVVGVFIALRHDTASLTTFLVNVTAALALLVAGRIATTAVISASRARRITRHPVVLIGGGRLARDIANTLNENPRYGLVVAGFVDDDPGAAPAAA